MTVPKRTWVAVVAAQACAIAVLAVAAAWLGRDELKLYEARPESEVVSPSRVEQRDGVAIVNVSAAAQRASGIAVTAVQAHRLRRDAVWYGSVVGPQALEESRARVQAAEREVAVVEPQAKRADDEYRRVKKLYQEDRSASERAMQSAEADSRAETARLEAARERAEAARAAFAAQWGESLAKRFESSGRKGLQALAAGTDALVRIVSAAGSSDSPPDDVEVAALGEDRRGQRAKFVGPAPQADAVAGGKTWFYVVPGADFRAGMRVTARAPEASGGTDGVLIPGSSVVWHGGKSWVYLQSAATGFSRREVVARDSVGDGWFVAGSLKPGDKVVTRGAQLLLSEEFRFQIKNENTD